MMIEDLKQISDGKRYGLNDMVKVGCNDCVGCSKCCCDMGQSVILDPMDVFRLTHQLNHSFDQLMDGPVELHVEDGLILPNLKMAGDANVCTFLNDEGRCSIHSFRPGICRLFPLGRNYEGDRLEYFLLTEACPAKNKSKMKVSRWLDTDGLKEYQQFLIRWHAFTKALRQKLQDSSFDETLCRQINMLFLKVFYIQNYSTGDFYMEFYDRLKQMQSLVE